MREIKFKGKSIIDKTWVYGGIQIDQHINAEGITHTYYSIGTIISTEYTINSKIVPVDKKTISQFTGLYDIDGKEIYENDIIKYIDNLCNVEFIASVKYDAAQFELSDTDEYFCGIGLCKSVKGEIEIKVLGNIFDNPELLGEQQ